MPKWEYKVVRLKESHFDFERQLNTLGLEEWELVSVTDGQNYSGVKAYLKRPRT